MSVDLSEVAKVLRNLDAKQMKVALAFFKLAEEGGRPVVYPNKTGKTCAAAFSLALPASVCQQPTRSACLGAPCSRRAPRVRPAMP